MWCEILHKSSKTWTKTQNFGQKLKNLNKISKFWFNENSIFWDFVQHFGHTIQIKYDVMWCDVCTKAQKFEEPNLKMLDTNNSIFWDFVQHFAHTIQIKIICVLYFGKLIAFFSQTYKIAAMSVFPEFDWIVTATTTKMRASKISWSHVAYIAILADYKIYYVLYLVYYWCRGTLLTLCCFDWSREPISRPQMKI